MEQVGHQQAAGHPQGEVAVEGRAVGKDGSFAWAPGFEGLFGPGQGVVKLEGGSLLFGEQGSGEVAFAAVGGDGHDEAALHLPGLADGHGHRGPGAHAQEQAFLAGQAPGGLIALFVLDVDDLVGLGLIEDPRFIRLLHVLQALEGMAQKRLHAHDADVGIELLHACIEAHEGAGGAHGRPPPW